MFYGLMTFALAMFTLSGWLWWRQRPSRTLNIGLHYTRATIIRIKPEESEKDWDEWAS